MIIKLENHQLAWYFGFGVWRKKLDVSEIAEACCYQSKWYQGAGIRMLKDGWLYNASTGPALKLILIDGPHDYIGCKSNAALKQALSEQNAQTN